MMNLRHCKPNPVFPPLSEEQLQVVTLALDGVSVDSPSCAGSGKSHTCRAIAENWLGEVLSIPFSRTLSDEEKERYAPYANVESKNFHAFGKGLCPQGHVFEKGKVIRLAQAHDAEAFMGIASLVTAMKKEGYGIYALCPTLEQIAQKYSIDEKHIAVAKIVLAESDADTVNVDYEDMLRFPVLHGRKITLEKGTLVVLDEVQDYSPDAFVFLITCILHPASLANCTVVMIGDFERQLLMAFAGAAYEIFDMMAKHFGTTRVRLTVNRRCAKRIVENAPFRGDMVALPDAPEGTVGTRPMAQVIDAVCEGAYSEAAILSEANAPLVALGLHLLTKGVSVQMRSARLEKLIVSTGFKYLDLRTTPLGMIGENLMRDLKKAQDEDMGGAESRMDVVNCIIALENFCMAEVAKGNADMGKVGFEPTGKRNPKTGKMGFKPIHPILKALRRMLNSSKGITLLTGHTAKGLEWNTVFHLPAKVKAPKQAWQEHQANCLAHVIATRAKLEFFTLDVPEPAANASGNSPSDDGDEDDSETLIMDAMED